ncbi:uncharacterized protein C4orf19 homolog [Onychomys torridus]|uniref:uncharacterized protein C4orf19 homolog n=1 Tax=Onychomys torridus TaxID=38674 RepID=UPI00167F5384|nr:uncharacterized protein C4orf19 homolog [Onychomys torridus]XP_036056981.1 uncharacterized protein C4orf19 homolog [Onychomys torridus]
MGCRCCKMIQSYLFDPVQVPSPGFVNEVNNCRLEEDDTVRLKGTQNSEVEVPRNALHGGSLTKTENRDGTSGLPRQGPLPQEDSEERHCAEKHGIVNGISPTATLHLVRSPRPHQVDGGSWASSSWAGTIDSTHPTQPFLEGEDCRKQSCMVPTSEDTQMVGHGDCRAPAEVLAGADHVLHIPAPDYPQLWSPTLDNADPEEKDYLFENHSEPGNHPRVNEQGLSLPFSLKRSWDSLNEAVTAEVLNVYFKEEGPTHPPPVVDSRNEPEVPHTYNEARDGVVVDEDAEVAEALAALEAATAGEDAEEAD